MQIEVFGTGCAKCEKSAEVAATFLADRGIEGRVVKRTRLEEITARGVLLTPAVFVDGEKILEGRMLREKDLEAWLAKR
jgi:small redox-active disulfide protein 2